ncbi:hypothetical protein VS_2224 [Vibrio atlanticus]|uniref:Uncharacterized protein n=1 Tax=Vibrio atlanticus (strain LGP32) TaxID=575788 RepID=B7VI18_VIBA3|nr:hypothetical protein VS_2224 [Vibrio atlanticus]
MEKTAWSRVNTYYFGSAVYFVEPLLKLGNKFFKHGFNQRLTSFFDRQYI